MSAGPTASVLGLALALIGDGSALEERRRETLQVDVQIVSISPTHALNIVPALRNQKTAVEAFSRLQTMLEREQAALLDWPHALLQVDGRFFTQTAEEY